MGTPQAFKGSKHLAKGLLSQGGDDHGVRAAPGSPLPLLYCLCLPLNPGSPRLASPDSLPDLAMFIRDSHGDAACLFFLCLESDLGPEWPHIQGE